MAREKPATDGPPCPYLALVGDKVIARAETFDALMKTVKADVGHGEQVMIVQFYCWLKDCQPAN